MTLTQYLIAWTLYILAAMGCLAVWWQMTKGLKNAIASWLRLWASVAVLTPGFTSQDMTWMTPALPAALYDLLTHSPEGMTGNIILLIVALVIATVIKLLFFRNAKAEKKPAAGKTSTNRERTEPQVSMS